MGADVISNSEARYEILDVAQGTPEWFQARCGLVTGSTVGDAFALLRDGKTPGAGRKNLRIRLALERVTGRPVGTSDYQSAAMKLGTEREPQARLMYEVQTNRIVQTVGFVRMTEYAAGYSPDGLVGDDGQVEFKCPQPATHLETLRGAELPKDYAAQVQHGLWVTGRAWCDWMSYNPDFPEPLQVVIVRIWRSEFGAMSHGRAVQAFLREVDAEEAEIRLLVESKARQLADEAASR